MSIQSAYRIMHIAHANVRTHGMFDIFIWQFMWHLMHLQIELRRLYTASDGSIYRSNTNYNIIGWIAMNLSRQHTTTMHFYNEGFIEPLSRQLNSFLTN